jgi:alkanesulfonate monooxygenase SsuD/methylene tetrahydromethanopterin reductase-like flavin-dependent oxidoreductase (luciferase family)
MRIGIQLGMHGHAGKHPLAPPRWANMRRQVEAAEDVGFDLVVIEDALVGGGLNTHGFWEGMSLAGAVAAVTSRMDVGHSVVNPPLRSPVVVAGAAATLDEISGGRYILPLRAVAAMPGAALLRTPGHRNNAPLSALAHGHNNLIRQVAVLE